MRFDNTRGVRPQDRGVSPEILLTWVLFWDRPHSEMAFRTRAVRFEDLHLNCAGKVVRVEDSGGSRGVAVAILESRLERPEVASLERARSRKKRASA